MEVINATFASNKIMQNMCTTINSQALGIDYQVNKLSQIFTIFVT